MIRLVCLILFSALMMGCEQGLLTQSEARAAFEAHQYKQAIPSLVNHGKAGDKQAMRLLAKAYMAGLGVKLNPQVAASWYFKAASDGDLESQVILAGLYETGTGVSANSEQRRYWLARAALQGDRKSASILYKLLLKQTSPRLKAQGFAWLKAMAEIGDMQAMAQLAELLEKNKDPQLASNALKWRMRAAEAGDTESQYQLALSLAQPDSGNPDYFRAWLWFDRAARQGEGRALVGLAGLMVYGLGRPADLSSANALYLLALERGYARAQEGLSLLANRLSSDQQKKSRQLLRIYKLRYPLT